MIDVPKVWLKFGFNMYQDIFSEYQDFDEVVLAVLEALNASEKSELFDFIEDTLRGNPTDQYLIELWEKSGASDILVSEQMAIVYEVILKALETSIRKK